MIGDEVEVICNVRAYPEAEITWSFKQCQNSSDWQNCKTSNEFVSF
jgi:hypothetical protein